MPRLALNRLTALPRAAAARQSARAAVPAFVGVRALHLTAPNRAAAPAAPSKTPPVVGGPVVGQDMMTGETTGGQDIDVSWLENTTKRHIEPTELAFLVESGRGRSRTSYRTRWIVWKGLAPAHTCSVGASWP